METTTWGPRGPDPELGQPEVVIATYSTHAAAARAVDRLSGEGIPADRMAIVGHDVTLVERVTGRVGYGGAVARTALRGAIVGAVFGWLLGIFGWVDPLVSAFVLAGYGVASGAVLGAALGVVTHAATRRRRDFGSVRGIEAERYDVLVPPTVAERARQSLAAP